ncbi:cupin domain-containing protein [Paraburkholderia dipogonis]|uniref:cupin domain-containing protein n=1 Tax=Paraburkholderia dipogonis TaxID=1211383 RepID=UPI0038B7AD04
MVVLLNRSFEMKGASFVLLIRRVAIALSLVCFTIQAFAAQANNPENAVSTVLLKTERSWDGALYKSYPAGQPQLTVLKIVIPAHTTLPWHLHAMPNAAYVLSGNLHVESRNGRHQIILHAGDVLPEMVGSAHRGYTDNSPVELIVFYAGAKGMPTAKKVQ